MTSQDLQSAIMAGNDVALQWYAITHQQAVPGGAGTVVMQATPTGSYSATFGSGTLLLAAIAIIAAVYLLKD